MLLVRNIRGWASGQRPPQIWRECACEATRGVLSICFVCRSSLATLYMCFPTQAGNPQSNHRNSTLLSIRNLRPRCCWYMLDPSKHRTAHPTPSVTGLGNCSKRYYYHNHHHDTNHDNKPVPKAVTTMQRRRARRVLLPPGTTAGISSTGSHRYSA